MHSSFVYFDGEDSDDGEDEADVYGDNHDYNNNGNDNEKHTEMHMCSADLAICNSEPLTI